MQGTIYDRDGGVLSFDAPSNRSRGREGQVLPARACPDLSRITVIANPRSHRNRKEGLRVPSGINVITPETRLALRSRLGEIARRGTDLVIVAGGDGTVRDVLTCGEELWARGGPAIAVLPRGKTNALAIDLGIPDGWQAEDAIAAWRAGRVISRAPIEITRPDEPGAAVRGFLFGAGMFVDATNLGQITHRWGVFNSLAVGLSVALAAGKVLFDRTGTGWRAGKRMAIRFSHQGRALDNGASAVERNRFLALITTMERFPMGVRPFGPPRRGMKSLIVDAPPRRFLRNLLCIVRGGELGALNRDGVHQVFADCVDIDLDGGFVLDGEAFPEARYSLREGVPVAFVRP